MTQPMYPEPDRSPEVNAGRLWAGGIATAVVAALVVFVGVLIARGILDIPVLAPEGAGYLGDETTPVYAGLAALFALFSTALLQMLLLATPRPVQFFTWIVGLMTAAGALIPFGRSAPLEAEVVTAAINLLVGLAVISLLSGVARTAVRQRQWS
ncbi:MAG: hypothetical protein GEV03_05080 [Streptosporangiales bacterium]|nr:hypothetical protein [Streptosporangiales bacterium]